MRVSPSLLGVSFSRDEGHRLVMPVSGERKRVIASLCQSQEKEEGLIASLCQSQDQGEGLITSLCQSLLGTREEYPAACVPSTVPG